MEMVFAVMGESFAELNLCSVALRTWLSINIFTVAAVDCLFRHSILGYPFVRSLDVGTCYFVFKLDSYSDECDLEFFFRTY